MKTLLRSLLWLVLAAGCVPSRTFGLSANDNNAQQMSLVVAKANAKRVREPRNVTGKPMAFMVAAGKPRKLIAWDLQANKATWTVDSDVASRIVVGSSIVAHAEGTPGNLSIVARDVRTGKKLWSHALGPKTLFLGIAADGDRVYAVVRSDMGKRKWYVTALRGGVEIWRKDAPGVLGAPSARDGVVYLPFMMQWLTMLDANTGAQIARLRQTDEALNFVRVTSDGVFYGSQGIFALDDKSATATKAGASYDTPKLPAFVRPFYYFDSFNPIQASYSAFDRNRVLWRAKAKGSGLAFQDGLSVVFSFRVFFAFDSKTGALKWAHHHPRFSIVGAEHVGSAILYVSMEGEVGSLDPETGAAYPIKKVGSRLLGVTFDADGFKPAGKAKNVASVDALAAVVWDPDSQLNAQRMFALTALGSLEGATVTKTLLRVLKDSKTPPAIYNKAGEVLVARKDKKAVPQLIAALADHQDFIAGTSPRAVETVAKALGALGEPQATPALIAHLEDPATSLVTARVVIDALGKSRSEDAAGALRTYLLLYRVDPAFLSNPDVLTAAVDALLATGGAKGREVVAYVAAEPRTHKIVANYARRALEQTSQGKTEPRE